MLLHEGALAAEGALDFSAYGAVIDQRTDKGPKYATIVETSKDSQRDQKQKGVGFRVTRVTR